MIQGIIKLGIHIIKIELTHIHCFLQPKHLDQLVQIRAPGRDNKRRFVFYNRPFHCEPAGYGTNAA